MADGENGTNKRQGKVIDFLEARRSIIAEHGTSSRGARSPLLDPLRKVLNAPDIKPLFEAFMQQPDASLDLIRALEGDHGFDSPAKDLLQALAHLGVERIRRDAFDNFAGGDWPAAVKKIRAAVHLAVFAGDWMTAEQLWLRLDERAMETGSAIPEMQRLVMFELGNLLARRGDLEGAIEFYLICEELAAAEKKEDALAWVRIMIGRARRAQGNLEESLHPLFQAADWAWEKQDPRVLAHAEAVIGASLTDLGRDEEAIPHLNIAAENAVGVGDTPVRVEAAHSIARALFKLGRPEQAAAHISDTLRADVGPDGLAALITLLYPLFDICKSSGRWGDFFTELQSVQNHIHASEQFHHLGPLLNLSAKAYTERGLLHLALHDLEEAAYIFQAIDDSERFKQTRKTIDEIRALITEFKKQ
ncbi:MAG: hypothetical protein WCX65_02320 [bacterium]